MSSATPIKRIARLSTSATCTTPRPQLALEDFEAGTGRLLNDADLSAVKPPKPGVSDVEIGDVLFGKLRPYLAKTWVADRPVRASTELLCMRPKRGVDSRWLGYLVSSSPFIDWAIATSDGAKMPRTSWMRLGEFRVSVPSLSEQRATASYLDREIARIDELLKAKQGMSELLGQRRQAMIDQALLPNRPKIRVKNLISRITSGPRGWAKYAADEGVLFLRIGNVSGDNLELDMSNALYVQPPETAERRRTAVVAEDVLVSITANVGSVGLVSEALAGASVSQHLALMTPSRCSGEWLAYALSTSDARLQLDAAGYGGTKTQLGLEDVANVTVPYVAVEEEEGVLAELRDRLGRIEVSKQALATQRLLLKERRQALITAAVSGQLDIPEAA